MTSGGILSRVPGPTGTLQDILQPLKAEPARSAVLLDVDGVLAPIVMDVERPEVRPGLEAASM